MIGIHTTFGIAYVRNILKLLDCNMCGKPHTNPELCRISGSHTVDATSWNIMP
jgi:hypothetical protein